MLKETVTRLNRGICHPDSREDDKNQKKSADTPGQGPHDFVVAQLLSHPHGQMRQSERCVPNSEISPEVCLLT